MVAATTDPHLKRREFLRRLMAGLGARPDENEDLVHDALLRFYSRGYAERGLDEGPERALLARVGFSTLIDARRRRRSFSLGDTDGAVVEPAKGPEGQAEEIRDLVARARLSDHEIQVLELRFGEDRTLVEIAARLGLHVNTIRRRLEQALESLRRCARSENRPALVERRTG